MKWINLLSITKFYSTPGSNPLIYFCLLSFLEAYTRGTNRPSKLSNVSFITRLLKKQLFLIPILFICATPDESRAIQKRCTLRANKWVPRWIPKSTGISRNVEASACKLSWVVDNLKSWIMSMSMHYSFADFLVFLIDFYLSQGICLMIKSFEPLIFPLKFIFGMFGAINVVHFFD